MSPERSRKENVPHIHTDGGNGGTSSNYVKVYSPFFKCIIQVNIVLKNCFKSYKTEMPGMSESYLPQLNDSELKFKQFLKNKDKSFS
jgi:hypothetical protein